MKKGIGSMVIISLYEDDESFANKYQIELSILKDKIKVWKSTRC